MSKPATPIKDRIIASIQVSENGCWEWQKSLGTNGYGQIMVRRGIVGRAHKVSYQSFVGVVPQGLMLDHKCRNKICVNPDHLEPVTHGENMRRYALSKTQCINGHAYTAENTYISPSRGEKRCRQCYRIRNRMAWHRNKLQSKAQGQEL